MGRPRPSLRQIAGWALAVLAACLSIAHSAQAQCSNLTDTLSPTVANINVASTATGVVWTGNLTVTGSGCTTAVFGGGQLLPDGAEVSLASAPDRVGVVAHGRAMLRMTAEQASSARIMARWSTPERVPQQCTLEREPSRAPGAESTHLQCARELALAPATPALDTIAATSQKQSP